MQIYNNNDELVELEFDYSKLSDESLLLLFLHERDQYKMNEIKELLIKRGIAKERILNKAYNGSNTIHKS